MASTRLQINRALILRLCVSARHSLLLLLRCRYKLKSGSLQQFLPTQRAKEETLQVEGVTIKAWDLGGHQAARQLWTKYAAMVRAARLAVGPLRTAVPMPVKTCNA